MTQSMSEVEVSPSPAEASDLTIRTPATVTVPWSEAHAQARQREEPLFVPVTPYTDDRGWSLMNLLTGAMSDAGQINFSTQYPGA